MLVLREVKCNFIKQNCKNYYLSLSLSIYIYIYIYIFKKNSLSTLVGFIPCERSVISVGLDPCSSFVFFFFSSSFFCCARVSEGQNSLFMYYLALFTHCWSTVHILFMGPTVTLFRKNILKIGPMVLFTLWCLNLIDCMMCVGVWWVPHRVFTRLNWALLTTARSLNCD